MKNLTNIVGTRYVLAVRDLEKSASYYKNKLGFTSLFTGDGWHFLQREKFIVMLGECPEDSSAFQTKNHSYFAYIDVQNVDVLFQEFQSKNIEIVGVLEDKPWGQREFAIRTIDGHRIKFGEKLAS